MPESSGRPRPRRLGSEEDAQAGLTLVELALVLLVVGVLLAIVLPPRLSTAKTAHKPAPANLLYTNGREARLGVCAGRTVPAVTAIDEGLRSSSAAPPTPVRSTTAANHADTPGTTRCGTPVVHESTQRAGTEVAGTTGLAQGACPEIVERTRARTCSAENALAGAGYMSAQST